ncbi:MAG: hypothetical protein IPL61_02040 [Myxococcales bacterium]|nr:hypothetical protein [Myxococcales bacterium]
MSLQAVATSDGHVAVVADGRLTLYALDGGAPVASTEVVGDAIVLCGNHLLVHAHDNLASLLTLVSMPDLTAISCVELAAPTRLLGANASFALVDRGDQAFVVQATGGNLAVVPLRPPAAFDAAFGLDGDQFLTFGRRGTETWDAAERRPQARIGLALPSDVRQFGVAMRASALWMSSAGPGLSVARLSDGRVTSLRLDAPAKDVRGHRMLSWLVAQIGADQVAINLALRVIEPLDHLGRVLTLAPVRDRDGSAYAVVLDGDRLITHLLGGDGGRAWATPPPPGAAPAGPSPRAEPSLPASLAAEAPREAPRVQTVSDRLAARRAPTPARAAAEGPPAPLVAPAPPTTTALPPTTTALTPTPTLTAPTPVPARRAALRPAGAPAPPMTSGPAATDDDWRDTLLGWARAPSGPMPALRGTPLALLHERVDGPATWPILCTLYAAWLDGASDRGIAIAELAARAAPADDRWREALGVGALDRDGLVVWDRGRAQLAAAVGEFLDGRPPRAIEVITGGAPRPPGPGLLRLDVEVGRTPRMTALDLADQIGVLAWCEPESTPARAARAALERGRLEAWLRGFPLATSVDVSAVSLRAGECLVWLAAPGAADHPGAPPRWRP